MKGIRGTGLSEAACLEPYVSEHDLGHSLVVIGYTASITCSSGPHPISIANGFHNASGREPPLA